MGSPAGTTGRARLRITASAWRERLSASLFLIPVLFVGAGMVLGQLGVTLDSRLDIDANDVPLGVPSTVESARAVLSTVASATVTVAGIALSISILTLQLASSQYSPRVVSGLFRDPFNKRVIGIVMGTFAYCLVVLRAVRSPVEGQGDAVIPTVSVSLGLVLGIVAILAIVALINHNAHTMDVSEILALVSRSARRAGPEQLPPGVEASPVQEPDAVPSGTGTTVRFESAGWVQLVDAGAVLDAVPDGSTVQLDTAVGRYAFDGSPLCTVWSPRAFSDEVEGRLRSATKVGRTRTLRQDESYGLRQLADVALKALSPGVNDPTTAQDAIFHLTSLLRELLAQPVPPRDLRRGSRRLVLPHRPGPAEWIALSFDEIRLAAAPHPTGCVYVIESIGLLVESGAARAPEVELQLRHHAGLVVEACRRNDPSAEDLARVVAAYRHAMGSAVPARSKEPA